MTKVCAYCRVSTDSKDQSNSFENQKSYFQRELSRHPDYELVDIYADKGISGTKLHRENFNRLLEDAGLDILKVSNADGYLKYVTLPSGREPKFKYIFVKNSSRFARNVEIESIFRDLAKKGVYVKFLDLGKSTEVEADRTYIQIFCSFDERESRDRREKVLFGIAEGDEKGVIRTNSKLYGYKYIKEENRLEVIEKEAEVIRFIFDLYSQGYGIRQIMNQLSEKGIKTRQGKDFCKTSINRILDNEKYIGVRNNRKYYLGHDLFDKFTYPHRKEDDEYDLIETLKIPPIIASETFFKCRDIRRSKIHYEQQKGIKKPFSKYGGRVYCDTCGQVYLSNCDKGRKFYNCKTKKMFGTGKCCNPNISEKKLDEAVSLYLENLQQNFEKFVEERKKEIYVFCRIIIENEPCNDAEILSLKEKREVLSSKLDELYDLFSSREGPQDLLKAKIGKTEKSIENTNKKIASLTIEDDYVIKRVNKMYRQMSLFSSEIDFRTPDSIIPYLHIKIDFEGNLDICFDYEIELLKIWSDANFEIMALPDERHMERQYQQYLDDIDETKKVVDDFVSSHHPLDFVS